MLTRERGFQGRNRATWPCLVVLYGSYGRNWIEIEVILIDVGHS